MFQSVDFDHHRAFQINLFVLWVSLIVEGHHRIFSVPTCLAHHVEPSLAVLHGQTHLVGVALLLN